MDKHHTKQLATPAKPASQKTVGRRTLIKGAATVVGGTTAAALLPTTACSSSPTAAQGTCETTIVASDSNAVVETTAGSIRGFTRNGIHTFRGIPYGASTAGDARFMPPSKPEPWSGLRSTMYYGPVSPQGPRAGWANDENAFLMQWDDGIQGEDCLRANVWTPGLDSQIRPVMVWLHGGGFSSGSGQELPAYHGENLARRGDVVVVTLNHRLDVLGYLNLAEYGEQYASSGNAGMLDIVLALEWVRDNIANFGGDPGNVLIFGQSGGGAKVSTLMAMPSAQGLYHKAVVQSGSMLLNASTPEDSAKIAAAVMAELGLGRNQVSQIHKLPYRRLVEAASTAMSKLGPPLSTHMGITREMLRMLFQPTADGTILPGHPFEPEAPSISAGIPMMIGNTTHEFSPSQSNPEMELLTEEDLRKQLDAAYGDKSSDIIEIFRKSNPNAKPIDILAVISAHIFRVGTVIQSERKAAQGAAPVFSYIFNWLTPVLDGRPRAFHCAEIPFVFYNTDVSACSTGGGDRPRELAAIISDAWVNFARTGDPNHAGLPIWPPFTPANGEVMIFDDICEVKNDPDRELRQVVEAALEA